MIFEVGYIYFLLGVYIGWWKGGSVGERVGSGFKGVIFIEGIVFNILENSRIIMIDNNYLYFFYYVVERIWNVFYVENESCLWWMY